MNSEYIQPETLKAFDRQSLVFDKIYGGDILISFKRKRVRDHIQAHLKHGDTMLELNCGTGEDALFFSGLGYRVHATDASRGMLEILQSKNNVQQLHSLSIENCSFTNLEALQNKGPFDYIFSNFGGLNCTGDLNKVLQSFDTLLKPGGRVTLVIINRFCLWEALLVFKGKLRTATRRFFSGKGRKAHIENTWFLCWYYSPAFIRKYLSAFQLLSLEGLCTLVPPSYLNDFPEKYPSLYANLVKKEEAWKSKWFWRNTGDYFIITMQKSS